MSRTEIPLVIKEHTAATYAFYPFTEGDWGAAHTDTGNAGNIAYTLPDPTSVPAGTYLHIFSAGEVSVTCTGKIVADDNAAADSVTWSEADEIIGWGGRFMSSGTKWLYTAFIPSLAATQAVA